MILETHLESYKKDLKIFLEETNTTLSHKTWLLQLEFKDLSHVILNVKFFMQGPSQVLIWKSLYQWDFNGSLLMSDFEHYTPPIELARYSWELLTSLGATIL
jgi:hypothetical protein